ncbi:hypothetical protein ACFL1V_03380 [Pseudomonadota bacterium]
MQIWSLVRKTLAAICLVALFSQQAVAQSEDDGWEHSLAVYLWGASISGVTAAGTDLELDFKDILDHLEMAAMGSYEGRKGKWSIMGDLIYMDLSGNKQMNLVPPYGGGNIGLDVNANLDMKSLIVHMGGGYNLYNDGEATTTDVIAGVRYLDLSTDLLLDFQVNPSGPGLEISQSVSEDVWDAIVGFRGVISLGDRWFMPWGGNIGAGDSDLTWQAMAGVGFKAAPWADIALTYRYLKWEFDDMAIDDLAIAGPLLGVVFRF